MVVSFENSPSRAAKLWVARRTGFAVPATKEPGPTEVGPVRPAIIRVRKKTWQYSTHKKTAGAVVRFGCQQAAKPGTRFMRCSGNVT
ncbi:hypothetical protein CRG93_19315 [Escherichia sp. E2593]|nr:hypothetical protein CRG93_19315 [Escherichia sp. E2593]